MIWKCSWDDATIAERYSGEVGEEYKERLSAKTDMHPQSSVYARTTQTYEDAEFGRGPLRRGCPAVAAAVVRVGLLDHEELADGC